MSASVVTCIGCLQCGATCGQCASRARSELTLPTAAAGVPICLKPRLSPCSVRLSREPRLSGSAPQLGSTGRLPAPLAARLSAPEPITRLSAPVPRPPPSAKDGKRIRDVCDFGDSAKVPEAVTKRKKDDMPAAAAAAEAVQTAVANGVGSEAGMEDDRPEEAVCNGVGDRQTSAPTAAETPAPAQGHSPPASAPARLPCQVRKRGARSRAYIYHGID